jgi:hypothetical protein
VVPGFTKGSSVAPILATEEFFLFRFGGAFGSTGRTTPDLASKLSKE